MARIHVNTNTGDTGTCKAKKGGCPFGGESGDENHYATKEEAVVASEKMMSDKYNEVYKGYRKGETEGMNMPSEMKKRLINEASEGHVRVDPAIIGRVLHKDKDELIRKNVAEKLGSQKLLRDMADDESARVRKAVAMRSNNRDVLEKLTRDPDGKVRHAAINNLKTPVKARKAAQAAIKAANIENLKKARGDKAPVAENTTAPPTSAPPATKAAPVERKSEYSDDGNKVYALRASRAQEDFKSDSDSIAKASGIEPIKPADDSVDASINAYVSTLNAIANDSKSKLPSEERASIARSVQMFNDDRAAIESNDSKPSWRLLQIREASEDLKKDSEKIVGGRSEEARQILRGNNNMMRITMAQRRTADEVWRNKGWKIGANS